MATMSLVIGVVVPDSVVATEVAAGAGDSGVAGAVFRAVAIDVSVGGDSGGVTVLFSTVRVLHAGAIDEAVGSVTSGVVTIAGIALRAVATDAASVGDNSRKGSARTAAAEVVSGVWYSVGFDRDDPAVGA